MMMRRARGTSLAALVFWTLSTIEGTAKVTAQDEQAAREQVAEARSHMERGQQLYIQGRYLEASEEFQRAYEAQPFGAFLYNAAVALERFGQWGEAADFFARYLEREPSASDHDAVSDRIEQLRTRAQAELASAEPAPSTATETDASGDAPEGDAQPDAVASEGSAEPAAETPTVVPAVVPPSELPPMPPLPEMKAMFTVTTNPEGAKVTLVREGRVVAEGASLFSQSVDAGNYRFRIESSGAEAIEERVSIRPGGYYYIIVREGSIYGHLRVVSTPPGAQVYIDDRSVGSWGSTPHLGEIATGPHRVWVERPGFHVVEQELDIQPGDEYELSVKLNPLDNGQLRVSANVIGAAVYVDGDRVGSVPFEGEVPAGSHRIRVEADGMKDWEQDVSIPRGRQLPLRARLRPAVSRTGAWITGTVAALLLTGGAVAGLAASNLEDDLSMENDEGRLASDDGRLTDGKLLAIAADGAFAIGGVLGILALYYFLRDPLPDSEGWVLEERDWFVAPDVTGQSAGLTAGGTL